MHERRESVKQPYHQSAPIPTHTRLTHSPKTKIPSIPFSSSRLLCVVVRDLMSAATQPTPSNLIRTVSRCSLAHATPACGIPPGARRPQESPPRIPPVPGGPSNLCYSYGESLQSRSRYTRTWNSPRRPQESPGIPPGGPGNSPGGPGNPHESPGGPLESHNLFIR